MATGGRAAWWVGPGRRSCLPLRGDQLVQPADLALGRLKAVLLQRERVPVDPFPGPGQAGAEPVDALFQPAAPALKDPQPYIGAGQAEEGEPDTESVVLPAG